MLPQKIHLIMLVFVLNGCSHFEGERRFLSPEEFLAISSFDPKTILSEIVDYVFSGREKYIIQPNGMQLIVTSGSGTVLQFEFKEYKPTYTREEIDDLLNANTRELSNRIFLPFVEDPMVLNKLTLADVYSMSVRHKNGAYYSFKTGKKRRFQCAKS